MFKTRLYAAVSAAALLCGLGVASLATAGVASAATQPPAPTTVCPSWTLHSIDAGATTWSPTLAAGSAVLDSTHVKITKPFTGNQGDTPDGSNVGGTEFAAYTFGPLDITTPGVSLMVDYSLSNGASFAAGAIRLFYYHEQNANTLADAPAGFVAVTSGPTGTLSLPVSGHVGTIGLVYDASNYALGAVTFSNLRLGNVDEAQAIHFSNDCPAPTPTPTPTSPSPTPTPTHSTTAPPAAGVPTGPVQTGGGEVPSSPLVPVGLGLLGLALAASAVLVFRRVRQGS